MKKLLTLLFAVALTLSLTSASFAQAGGDSSADKKADTKKAKKAKADKPAKTKKEKKDKPADAAK